jgi:hypothetical protein
MYIPLITYKVPLGILILARDVGLVAGTAYVRYMSLEPPVFTFSNCRKQLSDILI